MLQNNHLNCGIAYWSELLSRGRNTLSHDESSMVVYTWVATQDGGLICSNQGTWEKGNSKFLMPSDCAAGRANGVDLGAATGVERSYLTGVLKTWAEEDGSEGTIHKGRSTE